MVLNKTLALPVQLGRNSFLIFTNYLDSKQSECAMLEADLASGKWALEHEHTAAELANRSLEEARSELKAMREVGKDNDGGYSASDKEIGDLRAKLNGTEEQLLLRECNIMLCKESQKVTKKLSEAQS